jgi:hypothetical protein
LRQLFHQAGVPCQSGDENIKASEFVRAALDIASFAGGDAPGPAIPGVARLIEIRGMSGNEQLAALYEERETLKQSLADWKATAQKIEKRLPRWRRLQELARHARSLAVADEVAPQVDSIMRERLLLEDPDPVGPICDRLTDALRRAVTEVAQQYRETYADELTALDASTAWQHLSPEDREHILAQQALEAPGDVAVGTEDEILGSLAKTSLNDWRLQRDALSGRFGRVLETAAKLLSPKARKIHLPSATLSSEPDVDSWLTSVRTRLIEEIAAGPVIL